MGLPLLLTPRFGLRVLTYWEREARVDIHIQHVHEKIDDAQRDGDEQHLPQDHGHIQPPKRGDGQRPSPVRVKTFSMITVPPIRPGKVHAYDGDDRQKALRRAWRRITWRSRATLGPGHLDVICTDHIQHAEERVIRTREATEVEASVTHGRI